MRYATLPRHVFAVDSGSAVGAFVRNLLPDVISFLRVPLALALIFAALTPRLATTAIPLAILLLAYITDVVDGWLARLLGSQSPGGRNIDVFCDRVLHFCGFIVVATYGVPLLAVLALGARDLLVTCIRLVTGRHGAPRTTGERCLSLVHASAVRVWLALLIALGPTYSHGAMAYLLIGVALMTGYSSVVLTFAIAAQRSAR